MMPSFWNTDDLDKLAASEQKKQQIVARMRAAADALAKEARWMEDEFIRSMQQAQAAMFNRLAELAAEAPLDARFNEKLAWYSQNLQSSSKAFKRINVEYMKGVARYTDGYKALAELTKGVLGDQAWGKDQRGITAIPKELMEALTKRDQQWLTFLGDQAVKKLDSVLLDQMLTATTRGSFLAAIKGTITGQYKWGSRMGLYEWHAGTYARTAHVRFTRTLQAEQAEKYGVKKFIYLGPMDAVTRPWCREHLGKIFTRDEILAMNNGQTASVLTDGGGWNCRHSWVAVNPELEEAMKKVDYGAAPPPQPKPQPAVPPVVPAIPFHAGGSPQAAQAVASGSFQNWQQKEGEFWTPYNITRAQGNYSTAEQGFLIPQGPGQTSAIFKGENTGSFDPMVPGIRMNYDLPAGTWAKAADDGFIELSDGFFDLDAHARRKVMSTEIGRISERSIMADPAWASRLDPFKLDILDAAGNPTWDYGPNATSLADVYSNILWGKKDAILEQNPKYRALYEMVQEFHQKAGMPWTQIWDDGPIPEIPIFNSHAEMERFINMHYRTGFVHLDRLPLPGEKNSTLDFLKGFQQQQEWTGEGWRIPVTLDNDLCDRINAGAFVHEDYDYRGADAYGCFRTNYFGRAEAWEKAQLDEDLSLRYQPRLNEFMNIYEGGPGWGEGPRVAENMKFLDLNIGDDATSVVWHEFGHAMEGYRSAAALGEQPFFLRQMVDSLTKEEQKSLYMLSKYARHSWMNDAAYIEHRNCEAIAESVAAIATNDPMVGRIPLPLRNKIKKLITRYLLANGIPVPQYLALE